MQIIIWLKKLYRIPRQMVVTSLPGLKSRSEKQLILTERRISPSIEKRPATWSPLEQVRKNESTNHGGDKMSAARHGYARTYSHLLRSLPESGHLLEVGVFTGSSLGLWSLVLTGWKIFGLDIDLDRYRSNLGRLKRLGCFSEGDPICLEFDAYAPRLEELRSRMREENLEGFDLIIDDGPHTDSAILTTFKYLFPLLKPAGVYVIEDNLSVSKALSPLASSHGATLRRQGDLLVATRVFSGN